MKTYFLEQLISSPNISSTDADLVELAPCVLTIGNFDGVHLGHQAMLAQVREIAYTQNLGAAVMIFEPQPREFFAPAKAPARLTNLAEKKALLAEYGVETLIVAGFDTAFRSLSAQAFADILATRLNVKALVLGDDFRFGHDRTGDSQFLRDYGLHVTNLHTVTDGNTHCIDSDNVIDDHTADINSDAARISSTRVRDLLLAGDIQAANRLLGREYAITGLVVGGDQIGRTMDFPTANIDLQRIKPALHGIFAVDVVSLDDHGNVIAEGLTALATDDRTGVAGLRPHSLFGTASIGIRPSIDKGSDWRLEVHFPTLQADLYGLNLQVRFLHYLHGERRYDGLAALKAGIHQDVADLLEWREKQI
ncbi:MULTISPECIES: riboflavin biosynthesis protein RibF [unclassified Psychrobacter]|uniref:riboflavin biosynthesis protein RibF n=1 Tax=unclassified Psychrobacter TaxID=196806 RepID=UPI0025B5ABC0|nr:MULTISPECIES: riboflavin biosynthesis protein RibF [unclassified Psychrobacter]MDN3452631.1 riboflavin biosynthesis protein RibF [Psychrobacter sp. APC 3350]MDN3502722.1 riboflavin biosynthesis protein RibF [Psychrobacter sp. 5A.1]